MDLPKLLERSRSSSFTRWWMNMGLRWMIPFNRPHGFRVVPLASGGIRVEIPYWRLNRNHIRHPCVIRPLLPVLQRAGTYGTPIKAVRIIMKTLRMEYHYRPSQGPCRVRAFRSMENQSFNL